MATPTLATGVGARQRAEAQSPLPSGVFEALNTGSQRPAKAGRCGDDAAPGTASPAEQRRAESAGLPAVPAPRADVLRSFGGFGILAECWAAGLNGTNQAPARSVNRKNRGGVVASSSAPTGGFSTSNKSERQPSSPLRRLHEPVPQRRCAVRTAGRSMRNNSPKYSRAAGQSLRAPVQAPDEANGVLCGELLSPTSAAQVVKRRPWQKWIPRKVLRPAGSVCLRWKKRRAVVHSAPEQEMEFSGSAMFVDGPRRSQSR